MAWWAFLSVFLGALVVLLLMRVPVAFAMLGVGMVAAVQMFGGIDNGLAQVARSAYQSINSFVLSPIPLFILMGEVLFRTGIVGEAINCLDRLLGRLPGRLALLSTAGGTLFGLLSGSTLASTAVLGSSLLPQMERAGYSKRLSMGSVLAAGGLTMIIPPSSLAVLWGAIAQVSVGPLLLAGILPGLLMALGYVIVILFWSTVLKGAPAPAAVAVGAEADRGAGTAITAGVDSTGSSSQPARQGAAFEVILHLAPLGGVVFLVLGLIFLGVATPSESAATGAAAALVLALVRRRLDWVTMKQVVAGTTVTNTMIFFILVGSTLYSQLLSFSGATTGFVEAMTGSGLAPLMVLLLMSLVLLVLGAFMDQVSIMLVTIPLFMPVVAVNGWDPLWFSIVMLVNLQIAGTSPPFGLNLFVLKGIAPRETSLRDVYGAAVPFIASDVVVIALLIAFPAIVTFVPALMS